MEDWGLRDDYGEPLRTTGCKFHFLVLRMMVLLECTDG